VKGFFNPINPRLLRASKPRGRGWKWIALDQSGLDREKKSTYF